MQLGAPQHDPVRAAVDDVQVCVGVVLAARRAGAVALGVRDALRDADVATLGVLDEALDPLDVLRRRVLDATGRRGQRHDRRVGDVGHHPRVVHEVDLGP